MVSTSNSSTSNLLELLKIKSLAEFSRSSWPSNSNISSETHSRASETWSLPTSSRTLFEELILMNNLTPTAVTPEAARQRPESDQLDIRQIIRNNLVTLILPYASIFLLAIIGNGLVILTLGFNKRMRTVTNAFLLNLSISDLLLGVFCMPFTLVSMLVREFVFGEFMCRFIPYVQAVSVSVSSWTLVAMSYERYYAICHPLKSRELRQTWGHTKKVIGSVWLLSLAVMVPIAILSELQPMGEESTKWKCREAWPSTLHLIYFTFFLDIFLFVVPLLIMMGAYACIAGTLWKNMKSTREANQENETSLEAMSSPQGADDSTRLDETGNCPSVQPESETRFFATSASKNMSKRLNPSSSKSISFRCTHDTQRRLQQRRVIKMLFAVVLEFFICWTPLHVINTVALLYPKLIYGQLGYHWISFFQLLAFMSSCTNPITYCFMNASFRRSFLDLFKRCRSNV